MSASKWWLEYRGELEVLEGKPANKPSRAFPSSKHVMCPLAGTSTVTDNPSSSNKELLVVVKRPTAKPTIRNASWTAHQTSKRRRASCWFCAQLFDVECNTYACPAIKRVPGNATTKESSSRTCPHLPLRRPGLASAHVPSLYRR